MNPGAPCWRPGYHVPVSGLPRICHGFGFLLASPCAIVCRSLPHKPRGCTLAAWLLVAVTERPKSHGFAILPPSSLCACVCRSLPHEPLGSTLAARRLLAMDGWRVMVVPHHHWLLFASEEEQLMFVYNELAAQGC